MSSLRTRVSSLYRRVLPDHAFAEGVLSDEVETGWRVLDVGCGTGAKPVAAGLCARVEVHGVDGHVPSLEAAKQASYASVTCSDLLDYLRNSPDGAFDCLISLDVVEHFPKETGAEFLDEMSRVAAHRVIVLTPTGFVPQPPAPDNPYQEHLSGWWPKDLAEHGFQRFYGLNGWRPLRGEYAHPTVRPAVIGLVLSEASQLAVMKSPDKAYQFIGVRDIGTS